MIIIIIIISKISQLLKVKLRFLRLLRFKIKFHCIKWITWKLILQKHHRMIQQHRFSSLSSSLFLHLLLLFLHCSRLFPRWLKIPFSPKIWSLHACVRTHTYKSFLLYNIYIQGGCVYVHACPCVRMCNKGSRKVCPPSIWLAKFCHD